MLIEFAQNEAADGAKLKSVIEIAGGKSLPIAANDYNVFEVYVVPKVLRVIDRPDPCGDIAAALEAINKNCDKC